VAMPASNARIATVRCPELLHTFEGAEKGAPILELRPETQWRKCPGLSRPPVFWSCLYIDRYCETVHKQHQQRHHAPLRPRSEESRNALCLAHDCRRPRRDRLW